jgi:hypothetical protein
MLFKGSNNLVQIYRSFAIAGNYEGGAFLNMVFLTTMLTTADVNIHASNRQIWYRHPNSEAGNDGMPLHVMEQPPRFFALAYRVSDACIYQ